METKIQKKGKINKAKQKQELKNNTKAKEEQNFKILK